MRKSAEVLDEKGVANLYGVQRVRKCLMRKGLRISMVSKECGSE